MGNVGSSEGQEMSERIFMKRNESFGSKSPRWVNKDVHAEQQKKGSGTDISGEGRDEEEYSRTKLANKHGMIEEQNGTMVMLARRQQHQMTRHNRSHSLEQSGMHSPSSSRSSSSNSYINSIISANCAIGEAERNCLKRNSHTSNKIGSIQTFRQSTEPMFNISGDLNPHQIGLVRRAWKATMKAVNNEREIAIRILLRIFQLDPRNLALFALRDMPSDDIRTHPMFMELVNTFEPTLVHVIGHLTNATTLSKYLQQLGGRHVNYTGVTYKCTYWKSFTQALIDVMMEYGGKSVELRDALVALGDFCVEQMKIGYRIEHKLQCEVERIVQAQKRRRAFDPKRSPI